ncbi:hypothetical protein BRM22_20540 [Xanthomonas oryzae pv. oryzae]|uniref:Uncharacterized protein n=3 Tax=Xanthomonas oryzae TaxID=347 RepID=A0A854CM95_XANOO|nr:hypothetical protein [Xanthomonas oryzae]ALZ70972.1 hypothetical protein APZ20_05060 [Xanthomonas oryzae pv. oryzae]AOS03645.1 hypothetical protein ATY42_17840 [Xanthomonas oryzae pv. oryzae]AOS07022.1 hypothetical protein ATY43_14265 [Xanthomonas oryzae pv. oryzae]AOS09804.1 hypothetical protein ATY44_05105 [Xanthomonas oryzae pv. oryzae]AOS13977.1 hypothetical protein ATY45_04950 [Xanthomonas oryzae pv. oryzae]
MPGGVVGLCGGALATLHALNDCMLGRIVGLCRGMFGLRHAFGDSVPGHAAGLRHRAFGPINSLGDRVHAVPVFLRNSVRHKPSSGVGVDDVIDGVGRSSLEARIKDMMHHGLRCNVGASFHEALG